MTAIHARSGASVLLGCAIALVCSITQLRRADGAASGNVHASIRQGTDAGAAQSASVPVEIIVLHATTGDGGIDASLGSLPQLKKPPFSAYNSYALLTRRPVSLTTSKPETTALPNGRSLRTTLVGTAPMDRYRIAASINQPKSDAGSENFLPLLEVTAHRGEIFFVAGQSYKGGILVVGIKIGK